MHLVGEPEATLKNYKALMPILLYFASFNILIFQVRDDANLAHPVEQHPRNVQVLGSSPRVGFFWKLMGSGGSRGLQNRWLLKLAMAGSIPASSELYPVFMF